MARLITKTRLKEIIKENQDPKIDAEIEQWIEKILAEVILQIQED